MMGSMSISHWLIVLAVVMLVFGTKKLGNVGTDVGKAIKGFKDGMKGEEDKANVNAGANALQHLPQVTDRSTAPVGAHDKHRP